MISIKVSPKIAIEITPRTSQPLLPMMSLIVYNDLSWTSPQVFFRFPFGVPFWIATTAFTAILYVALSPISFEGFTNFSS